MSEQIEKVVVRPFVLSDLEFMVRWNNDFEVEQYVDCCLPKTLPECQVWFREHIPGRNYRLYAIEDEEGRVIGDLVLDHICWRKKEAELRIRIGEKEYWDQGYGSAALREVLSEAFTQLGLDRVYLRVYAFNLRAIHCYKKVGFIKKAVLKRKMDQNWKEIYLMSINKKEFTKINNNILPDRRKVSSYVELNKSSHCSGS